MADTFGNRCTAFPSGRHIGAPGAVQKQVRRPPGLVPVVRLVEIPGPAREDPARVARGPVAILHRAIASAMITLISSKKIQARSTILPQLVSRWTTLIMAGQN